MPVRQRPGCAKGVVFFTVEDELGTANLLLFPDLVERSRAAVAAARLVVAEGRLERTEANVPILRPPLRRIEDHSGLLRGLRKIGAQGSRTPSATRWRAPTRWRG